MKFDFSIGDDAEGDDAAAYDAFRAAGPSAAASSASASSQIEKSNFTDDQQFFVAWAQTWRTKMREQMLRQIVMTDGHAPDEYRADTVRNIDAWYNAFAVKPGQRLYLAPPDRIRVW